MAARVTCPIGLQHAQVVYFRGFIPETSMPITFSFISADVYLDADTDIHYRILMNFDPVEPYHCGWTPFCFMHDLKCSTTFPWCTINAPMAFAWCTMNAPAVFAWCMNHFVHKMEFSYIGWNGVHPLCIQHPSTWPPLIQIMTYHLLGASITEAKRLLADVLASANHNQAFC